MEPTDRTDSDQTSQVSDDVISDEQQSRRKALSRIGKYSAYAVPALLALSHKAAAASDPI